MTSTVASAAAPPAGVRIVGAREHNLRNVSLWIPKRRLVVFTGPSGSGKSSLAFDTLFAEGQRRYVESLSVYARQFLGQLEKADFDEIQGLSPTISIEQKSVSHNPRSTVGTITEVHDHLRLLYARLGTQHCHACGGAVGHGRLEVAVEAVQQLPEGTRYQILAPVVRNRKGEFRELFERLRRDGYVRIVLNGDEVELAGLDRVKKTVRHSIDVVVDRLIAGPKGAARAAISMERAMSLGEGSAIVRFDSGPDAGRTQLFSTARVCGTCDIAFPELTQQSFSFNSPLGRCPTCEGLGVQQSLDASRAVADAGRGVLDGAFPLLSRGKTQEEQRIATLVDAWCEANGFGAETPWASLSETQREALLQPSESGVVIKKPGRVRGTRHPWPGLAALLAARVEQTSNEETRERYAGLLSEQPCPDCVGTRLRPESRAVRVSGRGLGEINAMHIEDALRHFEQVAFEGRAALIGDDLVAEIRSRLRFLEQVGVGYLSLARPGPSLSGGEAQRIRLAGQLGCDLTGVLYVLDEPSIGLHQRDNRKLLDTLERLRDRGNTVLVVEHDRETMEGADWVVDFGPGAGELGGHVTFSGTPQDLAATVGNVTGDYLAGRRSLPIPPVRRTATRGAITIRGARARNLQNLDVSFPLGVFTCVSGVSGAGKSTLVNHTLYAAAANHHYRDVRAVGEHDAIEGLDAIDKVIRIDQQPIGRTPRSNPATYTKLFDEIRDIYANLPESRMYGYGPGRFSFNVKGGRCETCQGAGSVKIEMGFLADSHVRCDACGGRRFNEATLRVRYRDHSIADVLNLSIAQATELFAAYPKLYRRLQTLVDVGLGYMRLGQSSTTLSGGEAQRIKLSRELGKIATGDTLYILDEPSTGLHFDDVRKLLVVVDLLVAAGNTVVMIEHNLDILAAADHLIDLGPDGGEAGGTVVASGTPETVAACGRGVTAAYLAKTLAAARADHAGAMGGGVAPAR